MMTVGRGVLAVCLGLTAGMAQAQDWTGLTGAEVRAVLSDRTLYYAASWQVFQADGATLYHAGYDGGAESWGQWEARGDQYCSLWPPGDGWACYDVSQSADGTRVRFTGPGDVTIGTFRD
ncbi:MAG: hypothetical protein AAGA06_01410 [Pseudomonadota bacterium]